MESVTFIDRASGSSRDASSERAGMNHLQVIVLERYLLVELPVRMTDLPGPAKERPRTRRHCRGKGPHNVRGALYGRDGIRKGYKNKRADRFNATPGVRAHLTLSSASPSPSSNPMNAW